MPKHVRHLCSGMAGVVLLVQAVGCGGFPPLPSPQTMADTTRDTLAAVTLDKPGPEEALVYVFNVSRWTLLGSRLYIRVDGEDVAPLSRKTYTTLRMAPGQHVWHVSGDELELSVDAGRTYFVACAFIPGESYDWPIEGEGAEFRVVEEATARVLLRTYRFTTRDTLAAVALDKPGPGEALVYVFNASRWRLLGSTEHDVEVDGNKVAHLPQETYTTLGITPGRHLWKVAGRELELTVDAERTYFVALAEYPRDWPLEGKDVELREIDEHAARVLLRTYRFQAQPTDSAAAAVKGGSGRRRLAACGRQC